MATDYVIVEETRKASTKVREHEIQQIPSLLIYDWVVDLSVLEMLPFKDDYRYVESEHFYVDTLATDTRGKSNRYEMHLKLQECVSHPKVFGVFIHATNMHAASSCGSIGNGEKNVNTSTDIRPISIGSSSITVYDGANEITRTFADGDTLAAKGLGWSDFVSNPESSLIKVGLSIRTRDCLTVSLDTLNITV